MNIREAESFLPQSLKLQDVFQVSMSKHNPNWQTRQEIVEALLEQDSKLITYVSDIFTTGFAFFANRGLSPELRDMGKIAWKAVNKGLAHLNLTSDVPRAAEKLGVPYNIVRQLPGDYSQPFVYIGADSTGETTRGQTTILLPPEFPLTAKINPVEILAQMAWIGSQIRDGEYDIIHIDPSSIHLRALAFEAHFLRLALEEDSQITLSELYRSILDKIPQDTLAKLKYLSTFLPPVNIADN